MTKKWKVHLALLAVNLIYGANYSIAKIALPQYVKPFAFIVLRVGPAVCFYFLLQFLISREKVAWKDIPKLALCGLFGVAINQICFFVGLSQTTEINAALIMITSPILVLIVGAISGREHINVVKVIGIILGALGAMLLLKGKGSLFSFNSSTIKGDTFIFINAVSYSIYLVMVKKLMTKYSPITVISYVFLFGLIPVLFMGWNSLMEVDWAHMPALAWWSIAYVIIATTFFAYLLNIFALRHVNASLVGIYIYSQPIFAAFIAIAVQHKAFEWHTVMAALIIFLGVFLVNDPMILKRRAVD